jgi:Cu(I)/Ag(I) efflux system membrane protein CusA/SilA
MVMLVRLRAAAAVALVMPLGILGVFIAMRYTGVDANIVALSGIAIAIGTMADLGIVVTENVLQRLRRAPEGERRLESVYQGTAEVSGAVLTAVATTIVSFVPVFGLQGAEGKLFAPLAYTKTFALVAALIVTLLVMPALLHLLFGARLRRTGIRLLLDGLLVALGVAMAFWSEPFGASLVALGIALAAAERYSAGWPVLRYAPATVVVLATTALLAAEWRPLGVGQAYTPNLLFTALALGLLLGGVLSLVRYYPPLLRRALAHKLLFLSLPALLLLLGLLAWKGWNTVFGFAARGAAEVGLDGRETEAWQGMAALFPGLGEEFMPTLDEGSFLLMPTSMPHAGMEENLDILQHLDRRVAAIPEVDRVLGKLGRVESALDPAPISMFENIVQYKDEYLLGEDQSPLRFRVDSAGRFYLRGVHFDGKRISLGPKAALAEASGKATSGVSVRPDTVSKHQDLVLFHNEAWQFEDHAGKALPERFQEELSRTVGRDFGAYLIESEEGSPFRQWRPSMASKDDIWEAITRAAEWPGLTSAPRLQPIETRLVMLQTGMRAPMGIKVRGPDLQTLADFSQRLESLLKEVEPVKTQAVFAERVVGKPYLEIELDRERMGRYGLTVARVQTTLQTAIGGKVATHTVEGRRRYAVRVRYPRELRDSPEQLRQVLVRSPQGAHILLGQLAELRFRRGPQAIKSEETFLTNYVLFDGRAGVAGIDVVEAARRHLRQAIEAGRLEVPPGVSYRFAGDYENQQRAEKRLSLIMPVVLGVIFLILYFQFRSTLTALMVLSGVAVAFSGGFVMLWLYGQPWFLDIDFFGSSLRTLFQMGSVNLSVAVWVGFIALFGIATDDGVLMATYLDQRFRREQPQSRAAVRQAVVEAARRRIRPAMITTSTTLIALLPILSSTGKGSNIMLPMAIPAFGGMLVAVLTVFVVPVLWSWRIESQLKKKTPYA